MTLSTLIYAMMVSALVALVCLLVVDGVRDRVKKSRPLDIARSASRCVPGRTRQRAIGSPGTFRAGRARGASALRRR